MAAPALPSPHSAVHSLRQHRPRPPQNISSGKQTRKLLRLAGLVYNPYKGNFIHFIIIRRVKNPFITSRRTYKRSAVAAPAPAPAIHHTPKALPHSPRNPSMCSDGQRITKEREEWPEREKGRISCPCHCTAPLKRAHFREREKLSNQGKYGKKENIAASWAGDMRTCAADSARGRGGSEKWETRARAMKM